MATGLLAVRQSVEILASAPVGDALGAVLQPGSQWRRDRMLLSVEGESVKFVAGNTLYEQDQDGFLIHEFQSGEPVSVRRASWLLGLSRYEMPFCMSLAGTLALASGDSILACPFLERFSYFYRSHRPKLDVAARELRHVLEGLFALQRWPAMFTLLMDSMGPQARLSLPRGVAATDVASFLGRLLIGAGPDRVTVASLPSLVRSMRGAPSEQTEECLRIPQYRRMLENIELSAERVTPLLDNLRAGL